MGPARSRTALLLTLFFVSGAAALVYEVLWLKELGRLFGVTAHAAATTLAVFFLGLSVGSLVWGRRVARIRNPLRTYALLELAIAASALLYFGLLALYRTLYGPLFAALGDRPLLFLLVKFLLALGLLFPPAFFMGGTLPVMAQYLVRNADRLGRTATLLYAINTIGAACGTWLAGFHLPRLIGFHASYLSAMALNVVVAAAAWFLARRDLPAAGSLERPVETPAGVAGGGRVLWILAFASGFLTLALEVLWTRMFSQVFQNSVYTFAIILSVFLVSLALGSGVAHLLCRTRWLPEAVLPLLLTLSGLLVALSPVVLHRMTDGLQVFGPDLAWRDYVPAAYGLGFAVLALPGVVIGSLFPYLLKLAEKGMVSAGRSVGELAAVNTIAAILGSLCAGFLLLEWVGLWNGVRLVALGYVALVFVVPIRGGGTWALRAAPLAAGLLILVAIPAASLGAIWLDPDRNERLIDLYEGAHGTVAVTDRDGSLGIKVNNSYLLGTSTATPNQRMQSWIALALHPDPKRVFYLGMGTGITAGGALDFPVEEVIVAELNADVVRAAREHFGPWLNGLFDDSRARVVYEDGRNLLAATRETFDVIIGDLFLTYRIGVGSLYTVEHFAAVRERLAPGGVFVQWLPMFDLSRDEFGIIARSMLEVFPGVTLWRRSHSPTYPVYALVARNEDPPLDLARFRAAFVALERAGKIVPDLWIRNIPLAAFAANLRALDGRFSGHRINTDDRTVLEYDSPVTERNVGNTGDAKTLCWLELADWLGELWSAAPPESDPHLARVSAAEVGQVRAGLAYYRYVTYRQLDRGTEAVEALNEYRRWLGIEDGGDGPGGG